VKASDKGSLSQELNLNSELTQAEIYVGTDLEIKRPQIVVSTRAEYVFALYQNQPNPFIEKTVMAFDLPEDMEYSLTIFDLTGKALRTIEGAGERGSNTLELISKELPPGVLYYQLNAGSFTANKKMILVK